MHIAKSENGLCIPSKSLNNVDSLDRLRRFGVEYKEMEQRVKE